MSIRVLLDGHNFSQASATLDEYKARSGEIMPVFAFDTAKTVLIPGYLCENGVEEAYLRFNGMELSSGETVVASDPQDGIVALMAVHASVNELALRFAAEFAAGGSKGGIRITSPLLEIAAGRKRNVNLLLTCENAYLSVWDKNLKIAEVLPDNSPDSILYYLQVLGRRFKLRRFPINISGIGAGEVGHVLKGYYPKINMLDECVL